MIKYKKNSRSCFGLAKSSSILPKSKHSNSIFDFMKKNTVLSKSNTSQSMIISTVLLILLVIVASMVIFSFVIPFVKDRLASGNCIDVVNKVSIEEDIRYTCYDDTNKNVSVKIRIGDVRELIEGFRVVIDSTNSESVDIKNETSAIGISMYNGTDYTLNLSLPSNNGAITYKIPHSTQPESVSVHPILKGGSTCDSTQDKVIIDEC